MGPLRTTNFYSGCKHLHKNLNPEWYFIGLKGATEVQTLFCSLRLWIYHNNGNFFPLKKQMLGRSLGKEATQWKNPLLRYSLGKLQRVISRTFVCSWLWARCFCMYSLHVLFHSIAIETHQWGGVLNLRAPYNFSHLLGTGKKCSGSYVVPSLQIYVICSSIS